MNAKIEKSKIATNTRTILFNSAFVTTIQPTIDTFNSSTFL